MISGAQTHLDGEKTAMGQEVIEGILLGLCSVVCVVLIGVYITLHNPMILVASGISGSLALGMWFFFRSREGELAD